jgi:hypothetical protein
VVARGPRTTHTGSCKIFSSRSPCILGSCHKQNGGGIGEG